MKDFFTYVLFFMVSTLWIAVPIAIIGYIFSDDSFVDVIKTSLILSSGYIVLAFFALMLFFYMIYRGNRKSKK